MKFVFYIVIFLSMAVTRSYSQCTDVSTDINSNTAICGTYGDANGNSNWNWEITDKANPNYCNMWYARTSSVGTKLTAMGSPFVDASTSALDQISQKHDFTKAKGWELLRRDFGCSHVTAYPYFVLYNKYNGLMRVFVYQPETQPQYSGILMQIEPTKNPWPATTSLGDGSAITPDKYLTSNQAGNFGKVVVAVSEPSGSSRWSVAEFNPSFDPNIQNVVYSGTGLKFTIFGVITFDIKAKIKGRSVSTTDPKAYNFNYVPNTMPTSSDGGQTFSFTAFGEKLTKFGKGIADIRSGINSGATRVYDALSSVSVLSPSLPGRIRAIAAFAKLNTQSDEGFGQLLGKASSFATGAGNLIKFINGVVGFITGINPGAEKPAPMPTYTSYDMELYGTITAKSVQQSFILRVPGTVQSNNDNGTYFKCPLGLVNIKNTPEADTVVYRRVYDVRYASQCCLNTLRRDYMSYRMRNNLVVSYNAGAGLELVSVQAAIVGTVLPDNNGNASYDLLAEHYKENPNTWWAHYIYNMMRPDLEAGRLEVTTYDTEKGLHVFQTPYVNIECLNGLTFNADVRTKVSLRVKAVLRKKNDPDDAPILYIQDYDVEEHQGTVSSSVRSAHNTIYSIQTLPPYCNYTTPPIGNSDREVDNLTYNSASAVYADNAIQTRNAVIVLPGADVYYRAGYEITLAPGFEARAGSSFNAVGFTSGYNVNCTTPNVEAFQYTDNCYNTNITALRVGGIAAPEPPSSNLRLEETEAEKLSLYPVPCNGTVKITGNELSNADISIVDQSGKIVYQLTNKSAGKQIDLNLAHLPSGIYFVKINSSGKIVTKKLLIIK